MAGVPLLRTGAFARAASLSVKALRLYHEMGLLVPEVVDPASGYRAYAPAQLMDAAVIRRLRAVGVPLQDIRAILDARDAGTTAKVLAAHRHVLQQRLDEIAELMDEVGAGDPVEGESGVAVRREQARTVLALDGHPLVVDLGTFVVRCGKALRRAVAASGAVVDGVFGACYPPPLDEDRQEVTAFVPIRQAVLVDEEARSQGVRLDELPACDVAVLEYQGPYEGLEDCYRRLGTWVAFHAEPSEHPAREHYFPFDPASGEMPRTDLLWPIVVEETS